MSRIRTAKRIARSLLPRSVRAHSVLAGPLRGHQIVTSWHDYPGAILGYTERALIRWLQVNVRAGQTWLDVGAHYGYTALAIAVCAGPGGRVFAFEPNTVTAGYLRATAGLNGLGQLTVVPIGLDQSTNMRVLRVPVIRGMASSLEGGTPTFEEISLVALQSVWDQLAGSSRQIDGVKIDVQGMEIETLRGMAEVLQESRPKLVVELHSGVDRDEFFATIKRIGYSPEAIDVRANGRSQDKALLDDHSYVFSWQL